MANILSQEEVDALLRGISGGDIETEVEVYHEPGAIVPYDLTSQDRIIRGRMPTLEMINEKYAVPSGQPYLPSCAKLFQLPPCLPT